MVQNLRDWLEKADYLSYLIIIWIWLICNYLIFIWAGNKWKNIQIITPHIIWIICNFFLIFFWFYLIFIDDYFNYAKGIESYEPPNNHHTLFDNYTYYLIIIWHIWHIWSDWPNFARLRCLRIPAARPPLAINVSSLLLDSSLQSVPCALFRCLRWHSYALLDANSPLQFLHLKFKNCSVDSLLNKLVPCPMWTEVEIARLLVWTNLQQINDQMAKTMIQNACTVNPLQAARWFHSSVRRRVLKVENKNTRQQENSSRLECKLNVLIHSETKNVRNPMNLQGPQQSNNPGRPNWFSCSTLRFFVTVASVKSKKYQKSFTPQGTPFRGCRWQGKCFSTSRPCGPCCSAWLLWISEFRSLLFSSSSDFNSLTFFVCMCRRLRAGPRQGRNNPKVQGNMQNVRRQRSWCEFDPCCLFISAPQEICVCFAASLNL